MVKVDSFAQFSVHFDPRVEAYFFTNDDTKETMWGVPLVEMEKGHHEISNPNKDANSTKVKDWILHIDAETGKRFYASESKNAVQWKMPLIYKRYLLEFPFFQSDQIVLTEEMKKKKINTSGQNTESAQWLDELTVYNGLNKKLSLRLNRRQS